MTGQKRRLNMEAIEEINTTTTLRIKQTNYQNGIIGNTCIHNFRTIAVLGKKKQPFPGKQEEKSYANAKIKINTKSILTSLDIICDIIQYDFSSTDHKLTQRLAPVSLTQICQNVLCTSKRYRAVFLSSLAWAELSWAKILVFYFITLFLKNWHYILSMKM